MADRTTNPAAQDQAAVAVSSMLQNSVEADVDANTDDGYETQSDLATSASLASSVRDYVFENNRRYHKYKEGSYLLPNDEPEQEREDMKHSMIVHLCGGKLHCAPISNPHKIIDLGTGTGIWAIDSKLARTGRGFPVGLQVAPSLTLVVAEQWATNILKPKSSALISVQCSQPGCHRTCAFT